MGWTLVAAVVLVVAGQGPDDRGVQLREIARQKTAAAPGGGAAAPARPYAAGKVLRVKDDLVEFALGSRHGVRVGAVLPVHRPPFHHFFLGEVVVELVDGNQAVARGPKHAFQPGDVVVVQRTLPLDQMPPPGEITDLDAEITFARPAPNTKRRTFNARIVELSRSGPVDVTDLTVDLLVGRESKRLRYSALAIAQVRVNGVVLQVDKVKDTLVPSALVPIREAYRAEQARLERIKLAEIQSAERVRIAEVQANADAAVRERIALAQFQSQAEQAERASRERLRLAEIAARTEVDARAAVARVQADSQERIRLAEIAATSPTLAPVEYNSPQVAAGANGGSSWSPTVDDVGRVIKGVVGAAQLIGGVMDLKQAYDNDSTRQALTGVAGVGSGGLGLMDAFLGR